MGKKRTYLAVDLGASSGRVMAGEFDGERIHLREVHRFANRPLVLPDGLHWNLPQLYQEILDGTARAVREADGDSPVSIGVDTWGVDYGLLDAGGGLLGLPFCYRDERTGEAMEAVHGVVPAEEIYARTGIQFMRFNTLYQLWVERETRGQALASASRLLMMPDLLNYWLSGEMTQEETNASTTQLLRAGGGEWDRELIDRLGLPDRLFGSLTRPGETLGRLRAELAEEVGWNDGRVVAVASHDTASAVAAVPATDANPAYLSSGTWSLLGAELTKPVVTPEAGADGITNEIGIGGTVRFLKNIGGLWLIQESCRQWEREGESWDFGELERLAAQAEPHRSRIDPDDERFASPGNMPLRIREYCREGGQPVPETPAQVARCIYESLALKYAVIWKRLCRHLPEPPGQLHLIGGGSRAGLLNQMTANALDLPVSAGVPEATSVGNLLAQMLADGSIDSHRQGREIVARSFPLECHDPQEHRAWEDARGRYAAMLEGR